MGSILDEIMSIIMEKIRHSKILWVFGIGYLIVNFREKMPLEYKLVAQNIERTFERIYADSVSTLFILVIMAVVVALMKYSDKKSNENFENRELKYESYESNSQKPFKLVVVENTKLLIREDPYRVISFINNSGFDLEQAKGQVDFYLLRERKFSIHFVITNLKNGYGHLIEKQIVNKFGYEWDEFDFYIENAQYCDHEVTNTRFIGKSFALILPDFNNILDKKWFERFIPYNLRWLKDMCRLQLIPMIRWHFRVQTVYERVPGEATRKNRKNGFKRILLSSILLVAASAGILLLTFRFCKMMYDIAHIWSLYLWDLFSRVF